MRNIETLQTLVLTLARYGENPAIITLQRERLETWSFSHLVHLSRRLATGLTEAGVTPGAHVLLFSPSGPEWVVACFALFVMGAVPVLVDAQIGEEDLQHVLHDCQAEWCFTTAHLATRLVGPQYPKQVVLLGEEQDQPQSWRRYLTDSINQFLKPKTDDPAVLFYTSGTTGAPKGVPLTHHNITANLEALLQLGLIHREERFLLPLPLHHVYPFTIGMLAPLAVGVPVIFPFSLTGPQLLRALHEGQATVLIGVPRLYTALYTAIETRVQQRSRIVVRIFDHLLAISITLQRQLGFSLGRWVFAPLRRQIAPRLRAVVSGGAALDPDLAWKLSGLGWQVAGGYGLTETSPILTFYSPGENCFDSVGRPLPGVSLRIAPPEPSSQYGEVLAQGPNVFTGYYNLPEKNVEAFTADGYYRTGDLGYFDNDGYLHVVGRASSMIVLPNGENIWPEDIEDILAQGLQIREVGILVTDSRLVALIVPEVDLLHTHKPEEIPQLIRQAIEQQQQRIPSHRQIRDYAITFDPLPRTHLGKIRRHQLAKRYQQAKQQDETIVTPRGPLPVAFMSPEDQQLMEEPTAKAVWAWLTRRFPQARLTPDTHLRLDLDIDSLAWLNLTLELRESIGVVLTEEAIGRIVTTRDLLREAIEAEQIATKGESPLETLRHPEKILSKEQQAWLQPPGLLVRAFGFFLVALDRLLMYRVFQLTVHGYEHLPQHGPFLLLPNHISLLDPPALVAALSKKYLRLTYWGGWTGIMFSNPVMRLVSRAIRVVAIDPEHGPLSSIAFAIAALRGGYNLVWFPEGGISRSGRLQRFRPGIGLILSVQPVPIIPVWITGSAKALPPDTRQLRPHPITITFGASIPFEEIQQLGQGNQPESIAERLYHHMAAFEEQLLQEETRSQQSSLSQSR